MRRGEAVVEASVTCVLGHAWQEDRVLCAVCGFGRRTPPAMDQDGHELAGQTITAVVAMPASRDHEVGATPQRSPDGHWAWDGDEWVPANMTTLPAQAVAAVTAEHAMDDAAVRTLIDPHRVPEFPPSEPAPIPMTGGGEPADGPSSPDDHSPHHHDDDPGPERPVTPLPTLDDLSAMLALSEDAEAGPDLEQPAVSWALLDEVAHLEPVEVHVVNQLEDPIGAAELPTGPTLDLDLDGVGASALSDLVESVDDLDHAAVAEPALLAETALAPTIEPGEEVSTPVEAPDDAAVADADDVMAPTELGETTEAADLDDTVPGSAAADTVVPAEAVETSGTADVVETVDAVDAVDTETTAEVATTVETDIDTDTDLDADAEPDGAEVGADVSHPTTQPGRSRQARRRQRRAAARLAAELAATETDADTDTDTDTEVSAAAAALSAADLESGATDDTADDGADDSGADDGEIDDTPAGSRRLWGSPGVRVAAVVIAAAISTDLATGTAPLGHHAHHPAAIAAADAGVTQALSQVSILETRYASEHGVAATGSAALIPGGYVAPSGIQVLVAPASGQGYCLVADRTTGPSRAYQAWSSGQGLVLQGASTASFSSLTAAEHACPATGAFVAL